MIDRSGNVICRSLLIEVCFVRIVLCSCTLSLPLIGTIRYVHISLCIIHWSIVNAGLYFSFGLAWKIKLRQLKSYDTRAEMCEINSWLKRAVASKRWEIEKEAVLLEKIERMRDVVCSIIQKVIKMSSSFLNEIMNKNIIKCSLFFTKLRI